MRGELGPRVVHGLDGPGLRRELLPDADVHSFVLVGNVLVLQQEVPVQARDSGTEALRLLRLQLLLPLGLLLLPLFLGLSLGLPLGLGGLLSEGHGFEVGTQWAHVLRVGQRRPPLELLLFFARQLPVVLVLRREAEQQPDREGLVGGLLNPLPVDPLHPRPVVLSAEVQLGQRGAGVARPRQVLDGPCVPGGGRPRGQFPVGLLRHLRLLLVHLRRPFILRQTGFVDIAVRVHPRLNLHLVHVPRQTVVALDLAEHPHHAGHGRHGAGGVVASRVH
mmetsp:Transcript_95526/g.164748  ORF Transcript_95526/g.164748 Transcript_95526/m.164748 type:complete len:277 (+) Transcript_95526:1028-1858(+)